MKKPKLESSIETALHIGRVYFNHPKHEDFERTFSLWTAYSVDQFLIKLCIEIELTISESEGGWDKVQSKWVWSELIEVIVDKIMQMHKTFSTLRKLEGDLTFIVIAIIRKGDK